MEKLPEYKTAWVPADASIEPFCEAWCGRHEPEAAGGFPIHDCEWLSQCPQRDVRLSDSSSPLVQSSRDHHQINLVYGHLAFEVGWFQAFLQQTELDSLAIRFGGDGSLGC